MNSEAWKTLILSVLASTTLSSFLVWLFKTWISERLKGAIKHEYDQKLSTHKAELKASSDIEIERLKSKLSLIALEKNIKFSRLHEDRAEVISKTYSLLSKVYYNLLEYVKIYEPASGPTRKERRDAVINAHKAFEEYYYPKIIYIPKNIADKIIILNKELTGKFNEFVIKVDEPKNNSDLRKWTQIFNSVSSEVLEALTSLEDEFRVLLGDEPSNHLKLVKTEV